MDNKILLKIERQCITNSKEFRIFLLLISSSVEINFFYLKKPYKIKILLIEIIMNNLNNLDQLIKLIFYSKNLNKIEND